MHTHGVTEAVLERLDKLSRCRTPVDSPAPLVLLYSAASRRAHAVEAVWTNIMQPGLPSHARAVSVQCGRLLAPVQDGGRAEEVAVPGICLACLAAVCGVAVGP
jgi:hypothetical protein